MSTLVFVSVMILVLAVIWGGVGYGSENKAVAGVGGVVGLLLVTLLIMFMTGNL